MVIARGIMQLGRINVYPTASSFVSISPALDFAVCGDLITFTVKVENTKSPFSPIPGPTDGYVSVVDLITETIIGTSTLDASGNAIISNVLSNGIFWLAVRYAGSLNGFKPSQSSIYPFYVSFQPSNTSISSPALNAYYCPNQDTTIQSFVHLVGNPSVYPVGGIVEFSLWTDDTNFILLPPSSIDATGHAISYIPAFTTGVPAMPVDGYYLEASFDGYECFVRSNSSTGISGLKIKPMLGDTTVTVISVPSATLCYSGITIATIAVSGTLLTNPSSGTVTISDMASGTILGHGTPINGVAAIELDGYSLPAQIPAAYPHQYTIWANYVPDGYCYTASSDHTNTGIGNLLTIKKYFTTLSSLYTDAMAGSSHAAVSNSSCVITGTAPDGLDGYFEFKLYEVYGAGPDILTLTFGGQIVSVPATSNPFTATGTIPAFTMVATSTYYLVGEYIPTGNLCYDTTIVTAQTTTFSPT